MLLGGTVRWRLFHRSHPRPFHGDDEPKTLRYANRSICPTGPDGDQSAAVGEAIRGAGAELRYLPPYSPDLNPIENAFAKLKAGLRSAAARTIDDIEAAIKRLLPTFKPNECANYLAAAGYKPA